MDRCGTIIGSLWSFYAPPCLRKDRLVPTNLLTIDGRPLQW